MSHPLWPLVAVAFLSCDAGGNRRTSATATASASSAASGSSGGEAAPLAAQPPPDAEIDAGVREASETKIACGQNAHLNCYFRGRVRIMRAAVLEPGERPISQTGFPERATQVVLDEVFGLQCATMQLGGVLVGLDGKDGRDGPHYSLQGEMPVEREIMITLAPGVRLPFAEGDIICGSVMAFGTGYFLISRDVLVARPNGDVLLAFSQLEMPRSPSPVAGWTFTLGPKRKLSSPLRYHDMQVTHGGVSIRTQFNGDAVRLGAPDGEFLVNAGGYVTVGPVNVFASGSGKQGYYFSILRVGDGAPPNHAPAQ